MGFDFLDVRVAQLIGLEIGQAPVNLAVTGLEAYALPVRCDGFLLLPGGLQRVTQPEPGAGMVRTQLQHLSVP